MLKLNKLKDRIKNFSDISNCEHEKNSDIVNNLKEIKAELDILYHNLDYVTDPILLNQLIFQLKATEVRYQYWFCMAKDLNISNSLTIS